jgi:hypothetical protein
MQSPWGQPVFVRCKKAGCVGGGPARHLLRNTIEFCRPYFKDFSESERAQTTLHEMGHWLYGIATKPRDERSSHCSGGWNAKENMCYRQKPRPALGTTFSGGNPRNLALAIDASVHKTTLLRVALNNVDNYVSWMWNLDARARRKRT